MPGATDRPPRGARVRTLNVAGRWSVLGLHLGAVRTLSQASLAPAERQALEQFVKLLGGEYGGRLRAVWLYGSRARGEPPHAESDIDVIVLIDDADWRAAHRVLELSSRVEEAEGLQWGKLAPHAYDSSWPAERRRIDSFFIREVDRDKVIVFGEP